MKQKKDWADIFAMIKQNQVALFKEFDEITICIPETSKWDWAIPERYTNYQDGFLFPDCDAYKWMPMFNHPKYGILYLRWIVPYYSLKEGELEKYLCSDRIGRKYTVTILKSQYEGGNPSYFRFLPKVKKYTPKRKHRKEIES